MKVSTKGTTTRLLNLSPQYEVFLLYQGGYMDPILYWNEVALEANRVSHTDGSKEQNGPTLSSRALAIVHLAMYDAYAGTSGYPADLPAHLGVPAPLGAPLPDSGKGAAVAAAAHATLSALFPNQKAFFDLKLAQVGVVLTPGFDFGLLVAEQMLMDRAGDPGASDTGYISPAVHTGHRPDPDNPNQGYHAPFYGSGSKCFAVTVRHLLAPPPQSGSSAYTRALRQVRGQGVAPELMGTVPSNSRRTVDQTLIGVYWGYDGAAGLGTPPRLYNQIVREVALHKPNPATGETQGIRMLQSGAFGCQSDFCRRRKSEIR